MERPFSVTPDIDVLPSYADIPGFGILPVNAFLLRAREPLLVDTGLIADSPAFMDSLRSLIDPRELRWLWLTHPDQDHVGSLTPLLQEAPQLRVITTFIGVGILSLFNPLQPERAYLLNPGQSLDLGDRTLTAVRPPSFDGPATTGFFDSRSNAFFSSDCFGALMQAPAQDARDIPEADLSAGQTLWATVDAPWLHKVDSRRFETELLEIHRRAPELVLSAHLPPARGMTEGLLRTLAMAPSAPAFVGPDQEALQQLLSQITGPTGGPPPTA
jgi:hypothetical protein